MAGYLWGNVVMSAYLALDTSHTNRRGIWSNCITPPHVGILLCVWTRYKKVTQSVRPYIIIYVCWE